MLNRSSIFNFRSPYLNRSLYSGKWNNFKTQYKTIPRFHKIVGFIVVVGFIGDLL